MAAILDRARGEIAVRRIDLANEQRDIHEADEALAEALAGLSSGDPHPEFRSASRSPLGASIVGDGKVLKEIRGAGKVYDWRDSSWTPVNGGKIPVLAFVHHIPVVPNVVGIGDFVTLRNVLVAQRLMIQSATDREGNIALFTPFNYLCYQARGANSFTAGCEHMHLTTSEPWSKRQLRASAWLINQVKRQHGVPATTTAQLGSGKGVCRVLKRGQTTHEEVSDAAGFFDRTDPGHGYDREYVNHCIRFFWKHGHFEGA
jgi:hypothetical protein